MQQAFYIFLLTLLTSLPIVEPHTVDLIERPYYESSSIDYQMPDYPNGCEGVACAVLLRMNGLDISNDDFMAQLPKNDTGDFVHSYWGDPSSTGGYACMAPAIIETCYGILPNNMTVLDITGTPLTFLPAPCMVWTTVDYSDPIYSGYEQDGYELYWNTHCVILLSCDELQAHVWDPLYGYQDVAFSKFNKLYNALGKQAIYIAPRNY